MPVGPDLIVAYLGAEYAVFGEPGLVLRIGEASAALDELLEAEGAHTAAYVTAANPHGRLAGTAARWAHAPSSAHTTTRVPTGGPLPSAAARSTTPAASCPGGQSG